MATQGTPAGGLDDIAAAGWVSGQLTLVAYTNTANSLGTATVAADLVQPSQTNGYAPIVLSGTWSESAGVITYIHGPTTNPGWTALGAWSAAVTGVALIRGAIVRHFKDCGSAFTATAGKKLEVDLSSVLG